MSVRQERMTQHRQNMVDYQLRARDIISAAVLNAMNTVPRHLFVPAGYQQYAYADTPLPIPQDQTISQPYVVAYMIQALNLKPADRVLEIGTGSGYEAAVLACIAREVYTIEREAALVQYAARRLRRLGCRNVHLCQGDGTLGWAGYAPYQGIIVSASGPHVPGSLREQLDYGGRLVIPIGSRQHSQQLLRLTRLDETHYKTENMGGVRFVPLIGSDGWT